MPLKVVTIRHTSPHSVCREYPTQASEDKRRHRRTCGALRPGRDNVLRKRSLATLYAFVKPNFRSHLTAGTYPHIFKANELLKHGSFFLQSELEISRVMHAKQHFLYECFRCAIIYSSRRVLSRSASSVSHGTQF
jgi:hypothetical protein